MQATSLAELLDTLQKTDILTPEQRKELAVRPPADSPDPPSLGRELVRRGWLTPFQANRLVQGQIEDLVLGPYVLLDRLGAGGMGEVFKARHRLMNRVVAIKVIRPDRLKNPDLVARFHREIQAVARLSHPNIVTAYDAVQIGDTHVLAMEYVEGTDLARLVKENGPLPVGLACECAREVALALKHADKRGLVHRDIKPGNILLARSSADHSGKLVVKLLDLGLARFQFSTGEDAADDALTAEGAVMGTPDYIAPEQAMDTRQADIRADLYSLGCTLYHLLTGKPPFPGGTFMQKIAKHQQIHPAPVEAVRPEVPRALGEVVRKLMAKRPADRFQIPAEAAEALGPFTKGVEAPPERPAVASLSPTRPDAPSAASTADASAAAETPEPFDFNSVPPIVPRVASASGLVRRRRWLVPVAIAASLWMLATAAVLVGQIIIRIKDKQGRETEVEAPAGSKVKIHDDGKVTVTLPGGKGKQTPSQPAPGDAPIPAGATLLFEDTFDDDPAKGRPFLVGDPKLRNAVQDGRMTLEVLKGSAPGTGNVVRFPVAAYDLIADLRLRYTGGACFLTLRALGDNPRTHLIFTAQPGGSWSLKRQIAEVVGDQWTGKQEEVLAEQRPAEPLLKENQWTDVRIVARGEVIEIRANGQLIARVIDSVKPDATHQPSSPGVHTGIFSVTEAPARLDVDSVRVWRVDPNQAGATPRTPLSPLALVQKPAPLLRVRGWTAETVGHRGLVYRAFYSPGGRYLATAGRDGTIRLWEPDTAKLIRILVPETGLAHYDTNPPHPDALNIAWSPDSKYLASGGQGTVVQLWEAESGRLMRTLRGHQKAVCAVAWSADGKTIASGGRDGTVRLWNAASGQLLGSLRGDKGNVYGLAFAPKGNALAAASEIKAVQLWDIDTGQLVRTLPVEGEALGVAWSPNGQSLAGAVGEHGIRIWAATSGELLQTLKGKDVRALSVAWTPDGKGLASVGDQVVRTWDVATGQPLAAFEGHIDAWAYGVDWAPNGMLIVSAGLDQTVRLWDVQTGKTLRTFPPEDQEHVGGHALVWSADGERLASGSARDGTVRIWDGRSGSLLRTIGQRFGPEIRVVAWSPDGKILAASGEGDGAVRLWDAQTGDARGVLRGHNASLIALAWSPDGKMLASGGWDKTVRVWDARDARTLQVLEGQGDIQGLTWSPDSAKLAAANNEGRGVRVWQAATGKPLHTLKGQEAPTSCVVWSPDGKRLASASWGDDPIRFWDADTGRPLKTLELPFTSTLSWSPDGKTLAVGHWGGKISLRDPDTGSELKTLQRQTSALNQLTWSPDSNTLASCCLDRVIRLWNAGTGQALAVLLPLRHGQGVALSPDGHYRGTPQVERLLRYVVQTDDRQETLAAEEFEKRYGWHNDPERVGLVGPPVKAKPAGVVIAPEPMAAPEGATLLFEDTFDDDPKKGRPRTAGDARHSVGEKDGKHFIELRKDFPPEEPVSSYFGEAAHDFVCDMRLRYSGGRCLLWVRSFEGDPRIQLMLAFGPDGKVYVLREYVRGKKQEKTELLAKHEPGTPLFQQNQWLDLRLVARGEEVELSVNGRLIVQFTDPLRPSEARKPAKPAIRAGIIRASNTAARLELDHIRIWRIDPKKSQVSPGSSLSPLALVQEPTPLQGVRSWTVETVSHREHVRALAYRPDGRLLASASRDGTIRLWEPETGRLARILVGHQGPAQSDQNAVAVAWSPDGRYLATAGMDNAVQLWEAGTGRPLRTLKGHTQPVCAVAWSDDGRTLASGGRDGTIRLWDPASVQPLDTLQGEKGLIFALAWAPKSKLLAAATIQKAVQLWDTETSRLVRTFPSKEEADAVAWAPDGTMLAYADWKDHSVQCWDMATGRLRHTLRHEGNVHAVAWSPDGARLVSAGNGCVCIWDARSGQLLRTIRTVVWRMAAVAWAPDGKAIVSGGDDGAVRVWNPDTGEMLRSLPAAGLHTNGLYDIAWSPDGSMLASASSWAEATVRLWDSRTGQLLHTLEGHKGEGVRRVAWAPDSKFVASAGGDDRTVRVWDAQTGRALAVLEGHTHWVHSVAWSPDGKTLASGGEDHTVRLWDVPSGKCLHILEGHTGLVNDVAWSPDGQKLASTDAEGRAVRVWQAGTGKLLQTLGGQNGNAWRVAWLRDSKTLLSLWGYDRKVRVWNAETGKEIRIIPDTGATAFALALDQRSLAVGDWEGGLVVWDRRAAKPGTILKGHTGELRGLAWSPDGKRLASACEDGQIRLWDATSGRTLAVLLTLPHGQGVAIGPGGHYRGTPQVERLLRYVVQTDEGQETLTTEEFEKRFGWHNDPGQVRLSGS